MPILAQAVATHHQVTNFSHGRAELDGLDGLNDVGGNLQLENNEALVDVNALTVGLLNVGGNVVARENAALDEELFEDAFENVEVEGDFLLCGNGGDSQDCDFVLEVEEEEVEDAGVGDDAGVDDAGVDDAGVDDAGESDAGG